jgi:hypothetical protein
LEGTANEPQREAIANQVHPLSHGDLHLHLHGLVTMCDQGPREDFESLPVGRHIRCPGGKFLLAWKKVQRPLLLGGLGVLDLKLFRSALRLCWLWLQRTDVSHSWSLLPVNKDVSTSMFFQASIVAILGDGEKLKF